MGPVNATLWARCRHLAHERAPQGIRLHPISPGPLKNRAASRLENFELLLSDAASQAPLRELLDVDGGGFACAFLAAPYARLTGQTHSVDGGTNNLA